MKYLVIKIVILLTLIGCSKEKTNNEKILTVVKDSLNINKSYEKIFILQNAGCYVCNIKFAQIISDRPADKNELIIISAQNSDGLLKNMELHKGKDIVIDRKALFFRSSLLNNSAVIYFKNNQIDTILNLSDARVFDSNVKYISET